MPNGFNGTVEIAWRGETNGETEQRTVEAIETRTPGLVVNHALFLDPGYDRWWTVTHTKTGKHLPTYFPTSEQALDFAGDLAPLTDWTATDPERDPQFSIGYRRAMDRHGGVFRFQLEPDEHTNPPLTDETVALEAERAR
jgi:hypothetical protein